MINEISDPDDGCKQALARARKLICNLIDYINIVVERHDFRPSNKSNALLGDDKRFKDTGVSMSLELSEMLIKIVTAERGDIIDIDDVPLQQQEGDELNNKDIEILERYFERYKRRTESDSYKDTEK